MKNTEPDLHLPLPIIPQVTIGNIYFPLLKRLWKDQLPPLVLPFAWTHTEEVEDSSDLIHTD